MFCTLYPFFTPFVNCTAGRKPKNKEVSSCKKYHGVIFLGHTMLHTVIIFFVLLITMRIMGKRQVGEMRLSELVITLMLSDIATVPIVEEDSSLGRAIAPILLLVLLEMAVSYAVTKSTWLKKLLDGRPSIIISEGEIKLRELSRLRITVDELLSELRQKDIFDVRDVDYAFIENNGKLSVYLSDDARAASLTDLGITDSRPGVAHTLVVDGVVYRENLRAIGKDEKWLSDSIKKNGYKSIEGLLLLTVDKNGEFYAIKKDKKTKDKRKFD